MKITKTKLKEIIREEIYKLKTEGASKLDGEINFQSSKVGKKIENFLKKFKVKYKKFNDGFAYSPSDMRKNVTEKDLRKLLIYVKNTDDFASADDVFYLPNKPY